MHYVAVKPTPQLQRSSYLVLAKAIPCFVLVWEFLETKPPPKKTSDSSWMGKKVERQTIFNPDNAVTFLYNTK